MHLERAIDDRRRVIAHHAGAGGVVDGVAVAPGVIEELVVALDLYPRQLLRPDKARQRRPAKIRRT